MGEPRGVEGACRLPAHVRLRRQDPRHDCQPHNPRAAAGVRRIGPSPRLREEGGARPANKFLLCICQYIENGMPSLVRTEEFIKFFYSRGFLLFFEFFKDMAVLKKEKRSG